MTKKRRKHMAPLTYGGSELRCANAQFWPPIEVDVYQKSAEELRHDVPDLTYQRIKTWEQVCGIMTMSPDKCPTCPHAIVDGSSTSAAEVPKPKAPPSVRLSRGSRGGR